MNLGAVVGCKPTSWANATMFDEYVVVKKSFVKVEEEAKLGKEAGVRTTSQVNDLPGRRTRTGSERQTGG